MKLVSYKRKIELNRKSSPYSQVTGTNYTFFPTKHQWRSRHARTRTLGLIEQSGAPEVTGAVLIRPPKGWLRSKELPRNAVIEFPDHQLIEITTIREEWACRPVELSWAMPKQRLPPPLSMPYGVQRTSSLGCMTQQVFTLPPWSKPMR